MGKAGGSDMASPINGGYSCGSAKSTYGPYDLTGAKVKLNPTFLKENPKANQALSEFQGKEMQVLGGYPDAIGWEAEKLLVEIEKTNDSGLLLNMSPCAFDVVPGTLTAESRAEVMIDNPAP
jgi:hypothetical protein